MLAGEGQTIRTLTIKENDKTRTVCFQIAPVEH